MKVHTTISIDDYNIQKAKEKGLNISEICNKAIQNKTDEKEALAKSTVHVCTECGKQIEAGYFCAEHKKIFCDECHETWDFKKCTHDIRDGITENMLHYHKRFGFVKESFGQTLEDIEKGDSPHIIN